MRMAISADLHLREDRPRCRKDEDWNKTQEEALNQLCRFCVKNNCDLFLVGDIFHRALEFRMVVYIQKVAVKLSKFGLHLYYLWGNHDCLYHRGINFHKSAIGLLENSINCFPIKDYFENKNIICSASNFDEEDNKDAEIVFKHTLVFPDEKSIPPNVDAPIAKDLLSEFPNAKYIFTGDYHHNFHYEKNGRHVINPGCLLRQASDMKDYQCGVYCVDTEDETVEFIPIIDNEEFVDDSYILKQEEREQRIEDFVDKLKDTKNVSLDFVDNVQKAIKANNLDDNMINILEELLEV